jgi:hypothetical protein
MTTAIGVMTADAMRLAATQYNDATGFVAIMQANDFDDYLINGPVIANTVTPAYAGGTVLLLPPTQDIQLGSLVWCNGIETNAVVVNVRQIRAVSSRPFCTCTSGVTRSHILPPQGDIVTTSVTISPPLDYDLEVGSEVVFTVGYMTSVTLPDVLPAGANGKPT